MSFHITIEPSGRSFQVAPEQFILAAGISQGIGLPYGCKDGACGSCKCKKISGAVTHGPHQSKALCAEEEENGYVLTCCAKPLSDVVLESKQVMEAGAWPIKKMPCRVMHLEKLSHDVMRVKLQLPANDVLQYHAGQYVEFLLRDGARRAYSMGNAPHLMQTAGVGGASDPTPASLSPPMIELHIRHTPGGKFTDHVFGAMKEKEILRIEGPYGSFYLRESDKPIVFLASGTGFAPIKALIEQMQFKNITRPAVLYWGGRRPADLYMDAWVKARCAEMPNLTYVPVISDALPEDGWSGRTGFVHHAALQDWPDMRGHQVYACGAPMVVASAQRDFMASCHLPPDEFYADAFTTEADKAPS
jgi:CDP-4-dehydro-6-deoxyglucose reductase, E3